MFTVTVKRASGQEWQSLKYLKGHRLENEVKHGHSMLTVANSMLTVANSMLTVANSL